MSNNNIIKNSCVMQHLLNNQNSKKNDNHTIALNTLLLSTPLTCTSRNNDKFSDNKIIKNISSCLTNNISYQQNLINACYVNNASMINDSIISNDCINKYINTSDTNTSDTNTSDTNTSDTKNNQPNNTFTVSPTALIILLLLCLIISVIIISICFIFAI